MARIRMTWLLALCFVAAPLIAETTDADRLLRDLRVCIAAEPSANSFRPEPLTTCYAGVVGCSQTVSGRVSVDSCESNGLYGVGYSFTGTQGQRITLSGRSPSFAATVLIGDGRTGVDTVYASASAGFAGSTANAIFTAPHTGTYLVLISPNQRVVFGDYTLSMTCTSAPPPPPPPPPVGGTCTASSNAEVCISDRFKVVVQYNDGSGQKFMSAIKYASDSALFWFLNSNNIEVIVKTVNACAYNQRHWIYAGGTTDVDFVITITDSKTGVVKTYNQSGRRPFQTITDGSAFATCP